MTSVLVSLCFADNVAIRSFWLVAPHMATGHEHFVFVLLFSLTFK